MGRIFFVIALCNLLLGARALAPARDVDMLRAALAAKPAAAPLARGDAAPTAATGRREAAVQTGLSAAALLFARVAEVDASGGAIAGKQTQVAAKKRYNDRVLVGAAAFKAVGAALAAGDLSPGGAVGAFYGDVGAKDPTKLETPYANFQTAGYLLGNAFRFQGSTPPDKLPAVIAYKAFIKAAEAIRADAKKKDAKGASAKFAGALESLDAYLKLVELPAVATLK